MMVICYPDRTHKRTDPYEPSLRVATGMDNLGRINFESL